MEDVKTKETLLRSVELTSPIEVPVKICNLAEVLAELEQKFANNPAGLVRVEALRALPPEQAERWLLSRPAGKRIDPITDCVIVVTVTVVTVVVGYEVYKWWNETLKKWEERKKAITEEKEVKKEKLVCPDDKD